MCILAVELIDTHTLSMHRSTVLVRRRFSLPAYTRVTDFCKIFGPGNRGWLTRGMAYTGVYMVLFCSVLSREEGHQPGL